MQGIVEHGKCSRESLANTEGEDLPPAPRFQWCQPLYSHCWCLHCHILGLQPTKGGHTANLKIHPGPVISQFCVKIYPHKYPGKSSPQIVQALSTFHHVLPLIQSYLTAPGHSLFNPGLKTVRLNTFLLMKYLLDGNMLNCRL